MAPPSCNLRPSPVLVVRDIYGGHYLRDYRTALNRGKDGVHALPLRQFTRFPVVCVRRIVAASDPLDFYHVRRVAVVLAHAASRVPLHYVRGVRRYATLAAAVLGPAGKVPQAFTVAGRDIQWHHIHAALTADCILFSIGVNDSLSSPLWRSSESRGP